MKILIIGGAKSGKSTRALLRTEELGGETVFVATAEARDGEMEDRIARHQAERGERWRTIEEPLAVAAVLDQAHAGQSLLVDCLTLWLANLMAAADRNDDLDEEAEMDRLVASFAACPANVVLVANEVGQGIVPLNAMVRRYRDLAGRLNQLAAAAADEVWLVAAGLPLRLK